MYKFRLSLTYLALMLIFFCTSCSTRQYQTLFQQKQALSDTTAQRKAVTLSEYRIQPQDILQVRNLQDIRYIANDVPSSTSGSGGSTNMASQGQTFQVEEDGNVALPVIGRVYVKGLTRAEAQKLIEDDYRKNLLKNPIIDVKIVNLKVTLLGEVKAPGNYVLTKDRTTLVEVLGEAGGLSDRANQGDVKIIRGTEKNPKTIDVDLSNIASINDPSTILQSGDIIYVAQSKRAARTDNLQNFSTVFQPILILFNTALILYTLIHK